MTKQQKLIQLNETWYRIRDVRSFKTTTEREVNEKGTAHFHYLKVMMEYPNGEVEVVEHSEMWTDVPEYTEHIRLNDTSEEALGRTESLVITLSQAINKDTD